MTDEQDVAESVDEDVVGSDAVTSDELGRFDDAPDRPVGLPFADADVTDESLAERVAREIPDVVDAPDQEWGLEDPVVPLASDLEHIDDDDDEDDEDDGVAERD